MEHEEIKALIEAAADGWLDEAGTEMMQQHISTCPSCRDYAKNLSVLETSLRHSLQSRYPDASPEALPLAASLDSIQIRSRRDQMTRSIVRTASWIAVAALFIFAISWTIRNTAPKQPITGGETALPAVSVTPEPSSIPSPTQTAEQLTSGQDESTSITLFPNARFILPAQLPESPESVTSVCPGLPANRQP